MMPTTCKTLYCHVSRLLTLNLTPSEDFLNLVTTKPDTTWKMRIGFEMTYSGLLKLASTPVLVVDKVGEEAVESTTSTPLQPSSQEQKGVQFPAIYKLTNAIDTFTQSDTDRVVSRLSNIQNLQAFHRERSLNRNRLESEIYKIEGGDSIHLDPYISPENLLERGRLIGVAKALLESPESDPTSNQEVIRTYEALAELESNAKHVKELKESLHACATNFLEYSTKLAGEHQSEKDKNQRAKGLVDVVQQIVAKESSRPTYEPTENSCKKISSLRLELDAIYASISQQQKTPPQGGEAHSEL